MEKEERENLELMRFDEEKEGKIKIEEIKGQRK